jgi:hypothetical protein
VTGVCTARIYDRPGSSTVSGPGNSPAAQSATTTAGERDRLERLARRGRPVGHRDLDEFETLGHLFDRADAAAAEVEHLVRRGVCPQLLGEDHPVDDLAVVVFAAVVDAGDGPDVRCEPAGRRTDPELKNY